VNLLESHYGEILNEPALDLLETEVVCVELFAGFGEKFAVADVDGWDFDGAGPWNCREPFKLQGNVSKLDLNGSV
jgi:hypothetical protein